MEKFWQDNSGELYQGDVVAVLKELAAESVDCCITSPPYWGLRDYGVAGQIGLEKTPEEYTAKMVEVFREVKRVLKKEGTLWLNLGDSYASNVSNNGVYSEKSTLAGFTNENTKGRVSNKNGQSRNLESGLKPKDLCGIPWRVAFALQADGWYLRQDIIWHKPNPMPESVTDRCTKAHEYVFLMTKSPKYYFDNEAIKEKMADSSIDRLGQDIENQLGSDRVPGKTNGTMKAVGPRNWKGSEFQTGKTGEHQMGRSQKDRNHDGRKDGTVSGKGEAHAAGTRSGGNLSSAYKGVDWGIEGRNKRSVWAVTTKPYAEAHFATFPPDLIIPMIKAGTKEKGVVLDPFMGSGTTAAVAKDLGRRYVGIDLNEKYLKLCIKRLGQEVLF